MIEDRISVLGGSDQDSEEDEWAELTLNPRVNIDTGPETSPLNPLCPKCDEEIKAVTNDVERRYTCGCEELRQFKFKNK